MLCMIYGYDSHTGLCLYCGSCMEKFFSSLILVRNEQFSKHVHFQHSGRNLVCKSVIALAEVPFLFCNTVLSICSLSGCRRLNQIHIP